MWHYTFLICNRIVTLHVSNIQLHCDASTPDDFWTHCAKEEDDCLLLLQCLQLYSVKLLCMYHCSMFHIVHTCWMRQRVNCMVYVLNMSTVFINVSKTLRSSLSYLLKHRSNIKIRCGFLQLLGKNIVLSTSVRNPGNAWVGELDAMIWLKHYWRRR